MNANGYFFWWALDSEEVLTPPGHQNLFNEWDREVEVMRRTPQTMLIDLPKLVVHIDPYDNALLFMWRD